MTSRFSAILVDVTVYSSQSAASRHCVHTCFYCRATLTLLVTCYRGEFSLAMATRAFGGTGVDPSDTSKESKSPGPSKLGGKVKKREYRVGLKKRQYDNEMKTKIMQQIDQGARNVDICRMYNVPESTVRSMRKQNSEIKKNLALAKKYFSPSGVGNHSGGERSVKTVTDYNKVMIILEHYLLRWINRRNDEGASITGPQIQDQARVLYNAVIKKMNLKNPPPFTASRGWLHRFKNRVKVKYAVYQGEAQSADVSAASSFPAVAQQLIKDGNYSLAQIYNADETGVYWKRSPRSTYISVSEKQARGVKMAKDRFTALLTANADGTHRMKPLILYHSKRPRPYKNANMDKLKGYIWRSNAKGYMTSVLSLDWFDNCFVPDAKAHCQANNLDFRVMLFMDNAPGHARFLVGRHPSVQVVFMPPNTTSRIQPMDQEVIANTKLLFYQDVHGRMRKATDSQAELQELQELQDLETDNHATSSSSSDRESDCDDLASTSTSSDTVTVKQFWRQFNIRLAVEAFVKAWEALKIATLKHAWKPLLPQLIAPQADRQQTEQLLVETVEVVRQVSGPGFANVTREEMLELVDYSQENNIEDLLEEDNMEGDHIGQQQQQQQEQLQDRSPSTALLSSLLINFESVTEQIEPLAFENKQKILASLKTITDTFGELFNKKVHEGQQALITRYLQRPRERKVTVLLEAEGEADEGAEPTEDNDLDMDEDFSGFIREQMADVERQHRVEVLRSGGSGGGGSGAQ